MRAQVTGDLIVLHSTLLDLLFLVLTHRGAEQHSQVNEDTYNPSSRPLRTATLCFRRRSPKCAIVGRTESHSFINFSRHDVILPASVSPAQAQANERASSNSQHQQRPLAHKRKKNSCSFTITSHHDNAYNLSFSSLGRGRSHPALI